MQSPELCTRFFGSSAPNHSQAIGDFWIRYWILLLEDLSYFNYEREELAQLPFINLVKKMMHAAFYYFKP